MPPHGRLDPAPIRLRIAVDEGLVGLFHLVALELSGQPPVGRIGFRHHEKAGGPLVETVDDPGAQDAADPREVAAMVEEGVDQRPARMAGRRMDDHPRRLVDDQQRGVLVEDRQGDRLGQDPGGSRLRDADGDGIRRLHLPAGLGRAVIHQNPPLRNGPLDLGAGEARLFTGEKEIEAEHLPPPERP